MDNVQALGVSGSECHPECEEQTRGHSQATPGSRDQVQDVPCLSGLRIHTEKREEMVVTSIRVADVTLGIGRIPAGFYTTVQHSGCEWRTANVPVSLSNDVAQWDVLIPIPCNMSAMISLCIYASFEFQPTLGDGEQLRELVVTVEQLIDHSAGDIPFAFYPKDGANMSPCPCILVKVERLQGNDSPVPRILDPYCSIAEPQSELQDVTNEGHAALSRYRKHGERRDLEYSIELFERVLDICPLHHHCRAAAEANVAMAKFIHCQMGDSDISLDVPLALYRNALAARPIGHPDRPSTLIQLAAVLHTRFERRSSGVDATEADALLGEAIDLSSADSHEKRAALSMLEPHAKRNVQAGSQSSVEQDSIPQSHEEDPLTLSMQLLARFQQSGELDDLEQAISHLDVSVRSTSGHRHVLGLANLGMALLKRFNRLGEPSDIEEGISRLQAALDLLADGSSGKLLCLSNLGNAFLARFESQGEPRDLEESINRLRDAVDLCPDTHLNKPVFLGGLAGALHARFNHFAELSDLEQAISSYSAAVDLTPDGQPRKPGRLNTLGNALKSRFMRVGDSRDLEQAILKLSHAIDLTTSGHPSKPGYLNNLGNALSIRFQHLRETSDLLQAISTLTEAADLTPDAHPDKPTFLNDAGNCFLIRFEHLGELSDLDEAMRRQAEAVEHIPDGHPRQPSILNDYGNTLLKRFERSQELHDLEEATLRFSNAVDLTSDGHPGKPGYLYNLRVALEDRFQNSGRLTDLEQAISCHELAVKLTPDGDTDKSIRLHSLSKALTARFERLGELNDFERAASGYKEAVGLLPEGHPRKYVYLNNLGSAFNTRFERLGELDDLDHAISSHRNAVELISDDHPDKPTLLYNLSATFRTRFERLREPSDLERAIVYIKGAIDLTPDAHCDKPGFLIHLGGVFFSRFEFLGETSDLEHAISRYRDAVEITPDGHPRKPSRLSYFGEIFKARFERLGELQDLEKAISMSSDAVSLIPEGQPEKAGCLSNLGNALRIRFEHLGALTDLEQAISKQTDAVTLTPDGHRDKPLYMNNLGNAFTARLDHLGEMNDLEKATLMYTDAIESTPNGHPDKPHRLNNLGNAFLHRFRLLGELSDLEQAIAKYRDAVDNTSQYHIYRPVFLTNLGSTYFTRFQRLGDLGDLEQAISINNDAVELVPDGDFSKAAALDNLGNAFKARFQRLRELGDIRQAILRHQQAVQLASDGRPPSFPRFLNNLATSLATCFEYLKDPSDLEQAISNYKDAVALVHDGDPYKSVLLTNISNAYLTRFQKLGELSDLEEAISRCREAVELTPNGDPSKPNPLNNLGNAFKTRFKHLGEISDLDQAMSAYRCAVDLTPDGHPDEPDYLTNLAVTFVLRYDRLDEQYSLEQAILLSSQAACASAGRTSSRFAASRLWISCARLLGHPTLLHAYSVYIDLLPQLAWMGYAVTYRFQELKQGADMVREAAAAALDSGDPQTAVEWLEQGRSIVWGGLFQLRSSYDELSSVYPDHACKLRQLSTALEHASVADEKWLTSLRLSKRNLNTTEDRATESLEQEAKRRRILAIERDNLLQEIRKLPGFERFLLHKEFSRLRASAHSGPVVILNAAEQRCDALIIRAHVDHVIHVPLPSFTLKRSADLRNALRNLLGGRSIRGDEREGSLATRTGIHWVAILSVLWKDIVKPVLDALDVSTSGGLPRIFWCPTGPFAFLPIHAAGLYHSKSSELGNKIFDFVVSSYVPTLSVLVPSPELDVASRDRLRLLTVRQPPSDGQSPLPGVAVELEHVKAIMSSAQTTILESSKGTVEEVLDLMEEADWVHFACHGIQDVNTPADSGLCLADQRRLRLSDIIALSRPRGGLAFLSACQTATGDKDLSDEAIHIAAGMLFAGYGGVVGTMWAISDRLAPRVASDVYEHLSQDGKRPDYREAARALHSAVGRLRQRKSTSFVDWLPFIHVGL